MKLQNEMFGMTIPSVSGSQTIWVDKSLQNMDISQALSIHFQIPIDQVNGWLAILAKPKCQHLRKNGDICNGYIKDTNIPNSPDLFNFETKYACPAHHSQ
jgi:hypothetical protein